MDVLWQDLRAGIRSLAAHPRFTALAIVLLALSIGVTTAVFSVVNAVLLRPLPYPDHEQLVAITSVFKSDTRPTTSSLIVLKDMAQWRGRPRSIASMGAFAYTELPIRVGNRSLSPVTALLDPEFLPTLGNPLAFGSFFDPAAPPGSDTTAILSHALWVDAFARDANVVGRSIRIDGEPFVVRGVLAEDFQFPRSDASYFTEPVDLLLPAAAYPGFPAGFRQWFGIARLKPGTTLADAERELQAIAEGIAPPQPSGEVWSVKLTSLSEETTRKARQPLIVVLGIAAMLLLIASTNLMNLLFSRGVVRLREMSIRRAIGSTPGRLIRLLLTESLLLAAAGGLAGVWLASLAIDALVAWSPVHLPVTRTIDIDGTVIAFTTAIGAITAIAAGFFPAVHVSTKTDEAMRSLGMRTAAGGGVARVQQALCVAQIALGVALLAGAGLLANSLWRLHHVDPGFDAERVVGFNLSVPGTANRDGLARFYAQALDEIRSIPGVDRAGLISFLPPETRAGVFMGLAIDGVEPDRRMPRQVNTLITSADYFNTIRTPVVQGRDVTDADDANSQPVVVVNEAFVSRYLRDVPALGRRIGTGFDGLKPVREIVGIVKDTHDRGLAARPMPTVYIPFRQFALPYGSIALRTATSPDQLVPVIRDRLFRLNPEVPLTDFQTLNERIHESLREPRFYTLMATTCAVMAVLFVTFGLYGLVSYSVGRRTAELGVRMAIGATTTMILRMVLLQGLRMAVVGVALGLGLAMLLSRTLESLLFQVKPIDAPTFGIAAALVILVTLAASFAPARRASRVDPITALRYE